MGFAAALFSHVTWLKLPSQPPHQHQSQDHVISDEDFKLLDEFKRNRARLLAASVADAERSSKRGPPVKAKTTTAKVETVKDGPFTQAPQYVGREEALAAIDLSPEAKKKEKAEVRLNSVLSIVSLDRVAHKPLTLFTHAGLFQKRV